MKTLSEKIIEQLQNKHDAFLGTNGELSRQRFKDGLEWAIDTVETLTNLDNSEKEYEAEQLTLTSVGVRSEQLCVVCDVKEVKEQFDCCCSKKCYDEL